jgi:7-cyano-7-deazaguanine synthase
MNAVVLFSGGLDSTVLLHEVLHRGFKPLALTFKYNQRHLKEVDLAIDTCYKLEVPQEIVDITIVGSILNSALTGKVEVPTTEEAGNDDQPSTYVPFRNTILLSIAFGIAESNNIKGVYYGSQQRDDAGYWDCTDEYVKQLQAVVELNRKIQIQIRRPFRKMTKAQVVKLGSNLEVDFSNTYSCYRGEEEHCWNCSTCDERREAFEEASIIDPLFKG